MEMRKLKGKLIENKKTYRDCAQVDVTPKS